MNVKITTGFARMRDEALSVYAQTVIASMTGNKSFTNPQPALSVIVDALKAFQDAIAEAQSGSKPAAAVRDVRRKELERYLNDLGYYVQLNCNNDLSVLLSSGYKARKSPSPMADVSVPTNFQVKQLDVPGTVQLTVDKDSSAAMYFYEFKLKSAENWTRRYAVTRKLVIDGLDVRQEYVFRVGVTSTGAVVKYSDEIGRFVI